MANTFKGYGILFGTGSTAATLTGLGTLSLLQASDFNTDSAKDEVKDKDGNTAQVTYYDHKSTAMLDFFATSGTNSGTLAVTASLSAGSTIAVTDALFIPIAGTWLVDSIAMNAVNTTALRIKANLIKYIQNSIPA